MKIIQPLSQGSDEVLAPYVAASLVTHERRRYPTYYIKAEGEVDVAYVPDNRFWPVETKWSSRVRPKDIKQVAKYPNSLIGSRIAEVRTHQDIPAYPLPVLLLRFS